MFQSAKAVIRLFVPASDEGLLVAPGGFPETPDTQ